MSEPETKRARSSADAPYELIYWPTLPGRGEFVRLLFEEAAVPYTDTAQELDPGAAAKKVIDLVSPESGADIVGPSNPPVLAPPALRHGDLVISQTPNILLYLAPKLGLGPKPGDDAAFHLNEIVLTLSDGLVAELHDTHHPTAVSLTYEEQKPEAKKRTRYFLDERLPKFLGYAQRVIDAKTSGEGPWLYGGSLTYADLYLFQVCVLPSVFSLPLVVIGPCVY
jgi:glutathione S-transferase